MPADEGTAADALREELARLRAENDALRARFRGVDPSPPRSHRPVRVLVLPDPLDPVESGRPGPEVVSNLARTTIAVLRERQPDVDWRAEHDLARIPAGAQCFHLGQVLRRLWDGCGPLPIVLEVEYGDGGELRLRRPLVCGDPDSDHFIGGYERQLRIADDLLAEAAAAHSAGAQHHAGWTLKAVDLVLARLALALEAFRAGRPDWRDQLDAVRPEYEPRYRVGDELPARS